MKTFVLILFISLSCINMNALSIDGPDRILGTWLTYKKDGKVEIFKSGDKYYGKLIWATDLYEPGGKVLKKDVLNPDPKLRERYIHNFIFMTDFEYNDGVWENGKIYDASTGKSYDCYMNYVNGKIAISAFVGLHIFGRTEEWQRIN
jgi:uncharacterized protein (DUF2147 family)